MKLPLALFALVSCSASALVPDTQIETETPPKVARLAKRDWPKFVEHLRGPCHKDCAGHYVDCKKWHCMVNEWGCSKLCYMEICHANEGICKGCHYC